MITKCLWFLRYLIFTSSPFRSLIKGAALFSWWHMKYRQKLYQFCSTCYHKIFMMKELFLKNNAFSNSIFELYRASAFFELEYWDSKSTNFSPLSTIRENLKKISWVVSENISELNDTLKFRKSLISRTGNDVITQKNIFGLFRPTYNIPEIFMKIRQCVLDKSSKKKKE